MKAVINRNSTALWAAMLSAMLVAATLFSRPLLPPDETRYISVAWEMHQRGDYLVPHLNQETYSHKPPLLFWLVNGVWTFTGISELAARCVAPLFALQALFQTTRLAKSLWPDTTTHQIAPLVMASLMLWMVFCPLTMFDTMLTSMTLISLTGLREYQEGKRVQGLLMAGIACGLGVLAKGPVILVFVLPVAITMSLSANAGSRVHWSTIPVLIGLAAIVAGCWVVPAVLSGGPGFRNDLLFGQTAGRMANSFAHRQPFWWYAPVLPLCLLPWILIPSVWQRIWRLRSTPSVRFCLAWAGGSLLILSLVSGKQIYYLLPMIPAAALLISRGLAETMLTKRELRTISFATLVLAASPLVLNHGTQRTFPALASLVSDIWVVPFAICGLAVLGLERLSGIVRQVAGISTAAVIFMALVVFSVRHSIWDGFDLSPLAAFFRGTAVPAAWYANYHGQLNFLSPIEHVEEIQSEEELRGWLIRNRNGHIVVRVEHWTPEGLNELIRLTGREQVLSEPELQALPALLLCHSDMVGRTWKPTVHFAQWIRRGLRSDLHVVVSFLEPPDLSKH